uniref:peptidoglycan-binding protein n=1 Tax=Pedobacter schmidteae TaxID=2201271 RepID=UPI001D0092F9|nr:peptidoglycan-binding protein [Pedobacter schmidteae]
MGTTKIFCGLVCLAVIGLCGVHYCGGVAVPDQVRNDGKGARVFVVKTKKENYENVIKIARKEIGVREKGCQNCGARIRDYLNCVGIKSPAPYCAAWVSWCFAQAGYPQPRTAWSPALFPAARVVKAPEPAIVFGIYFPKLKRIAHVGLVARLQGDWIVALEANTNVAGSREGQGVYERLRHKRTIHRYADWLK